MAGSPAGLPHPAERTELPGAGTPRRREEQGLEDEVLKTVKISRSLKLGFQDKALKTRSRRRGLEDSDDKVLKTRC